MLFKKIDKNIRENQELLNLIKEVNVFEKDIRDLESYKKLQKVRLLRPILKKVIMRESYSASIPRLVNEILDELCEVVEGKNTYYTYSNTDIKLNRHDIVTYVMSLKSVAAKVAPSIKNLSNYLDSIARICTELNIPIPWILPHKGAQINSSYLTEVEESFAAFSFTKTKYTFKKYLPDKYDLKKQKRAVRPNLIHSLDATAIAMLYLEL